MLDPMLSPTSFHQALINWARYARISLTEGAARDRLDVVIYPTVSVLKRHASSGRHVVQDSRVPWCIFHDAQAGAADCRQDGVLVVIVPRFPIGRKPLENIKAILHGQRELASWEPRRGTVSPEGAAVFWYPSPRPIITRCSTCHPNHATSEQGLW